MVECTETTILLNIQVLGVSMECLGTAPVADLPLLLKFIVGQVTSKNAVEVSNTHTHSHSLLCAV